MVINTFLAGASWGREVAGKWEWSSATLNSKMQLNCPDDAEISYYKYLESYMADKPRSEFKAAVGSFADSNEIIGVIADQIVRALLAPEHLWATPFAIEQGGVWYHFVFPGIWKLFSTLEAQGRRFSVVVR